MQWRPLTRAERQLAVVWGGLALAVVALEPLWVVIAPLLRPCLLRSLTGIPCPTCGATRGALALLDGRLLEALALNPLVTAGAVAFLVGGVAAPLWAWLAGTTPVIEGPLPVWLRVAIVAAIAANWVWLIAAS
jgi:hypothetical protein